MKRHVVINGRFLTHRITGVERCSIEIVEAIDRLVGSGYVDSENVTFTLISPRQTVTDIQLKNIQWQKRGIFSGHLWEQAELPFYSRGGYLLSLAMTSCLAKSRQAVMIHDAAVFANPNSFRLAFRLWYKILLSGLCRIADTIITPSEFSKQELIRFCRMPGDKAQVVYEGKEQITKVEPDNSIFQRVGLQRGSYILLVSSNSPNKNFRNAIKAVELLRDLNVEIVVAGGGDRGVFKGTPTLDHVRHLGYVSDEELKALYSHAACFVFPSFYEGFGLPPLEAMACGCPVIVSNTSSMPEVCGTAALYVDPNSIEDIAEKIRQVVVEPKLRESLRLAGLERASHFSWNYTAKEIVDLLKVNR